MPDHPSTTLRDRLKPIPIPEAYHCALTKLRDERDFERRCNRVLETRLREVVAVTYESTNPVIGLTRIRGIAGACLLTYRQERTNRKRTWRDILSAWWTTRVAAWRAR